jgi:hypothetical protein
MLTTCRAHHYPHHSAMVRLLGAFPRKPSAKEAPRFHSGTSAVRTIRLPILLIVRRDKVGEQGPSCIRRDDGRQYVAYGHVLPACH